MTTYLLVIDMPDPDESQDLSDLATEWAYQLHADDLTVFPVEILDDPEGLEELRETAHLISSSLQ
jgi:hypothetical protein